MNKRRNAWRSHINIGTVLFFLIVIYLAGNVIRYISKSKHAIYEVNQSEISDVIQGNGIILREEKVITTKEDGYISSYLAEGEHVRAKGIVYTIDKNGKIQDEINRILKENNTSLNLEKTQIFEDLRNFTEGYDSMNFYTVSETKNAIDHDILSYSGNLLSKNKKLLEKKFGKGCYVEVRSKASGLVSYSSDGLEKMTEDSLDSRVFNNAKHMEDLRTNQYCEKGTKAYRITTSQKWRLLIQVTDSEYDRMKTLYDGGTTYVKATIRKDNFSVKVPFDCLENKSGKYIRLNFTNYVHRYLNQRFLDVEILLLQGKGLKIPASSLVSRKVYRIPESYLSLGANQGSDNHVNVVYKDKKGREKLRQVTVNVVKQGEGDNIAGVYSQELKAGDVIKNIETKETYTLGKTVNTYGVYTVNSGYAVFNYVIIKERNEDYCIIDSERSEVKIYDRIILNSDSINENEIIY